MTEEQIIQIAKTCHEVNKTFCESIGDMSQKPWNESPEWQRKSSIDSVRFKIENPNSTPEDLHKSWMDCKIKDGWRYGPVKNGETKEHPCIVEYSKLPKDQQTKDYLFSAVVKSFI